MKNRAHLYQIICVTFCVIVVLSNIISAKMVSLPFFQNFSIPAGLLTYPLTFLLSDFITEIYGAKKARFMVYTAFAMNLLSFGVLELTLLLPTHSIEEQNAFQAVVGLSGVRIFSSLIAYLAAQLVDIKLYAWIKRLTGQRFLWLRNNGSTCASQIVDTVVIDLIFLYGGLGMEMHLVMRIMIISYIYKAFFSALSTPLLYVLVFMMRNQLKLSPFFVKKPLINSK